jgi:hypothetical protein
MANLLDRVMKKFMRHVDLEPNKSDHDARMNAKAAGPMTTRGVKFRGDRTTGGHRTGRARSAQPHKTHRWSDMLHRGH